MDHFVAPHRLSMAIHRQCLTLTTPESLLRGPRTNIPSGLLQKTSEQDSISFTTGMFKGRSWQASNSTVVNFALCGQHLHKSLYTGGPSQSAILRVNLTQMQAIEIKTHLQQEGQCNSHKRHSWSTRLRWSKKLHHWVPLDT